MSKTHSNRSTTQIILTIVGMTGIVGLFLPFTLGASPVDTLNLSPEDIFLVTSRLLAFPAFLSIFASAASIRWIVSGSFSRLERAIAYVVSAATAGVTLYVNLDKGIDGGPLGFQELLLMVVPVVILFSGVYLLIRNSKIGRLKEFNPVMSIQVAYLAHVALCLIGFFGAWEAGAYCILVAAVAFFLQIIFISVQSARPEEESVGHQ